MAFNMPQEFPTVSLDITDICTLSKAVDFLTQCQNVLGFAAWAPAFFIQFITTLTVGALSMAARKERKKTLWACAIET